jgi:hypothetical protein
MDTNQHTSGDYAWEFEALDGWPNGFVAEYVIGDDADYVDYITPDSASDCIWMVPGSAR